MSTAPGLTFGSLPVTETEAANEPSIENTTCKKNLSNDHTSYLIDTVQYCEFTKLRNKLVGAKNGGGGHKPRTTYSCSLSLCLPILKKFLAKKARNVFVAMKLTFLEQLNSHETSFSNCYQKILLTFHCLNKLI